MISHILGIETSCDECSASVVRYRPNEPLKVLALSTFSQITIHQPYGGVVPEIASRNHLITINPMIERALKDAHLEPRQIDAIAVSNRPGLIGSLLVGVSTAKALAYVHKKPLIPVHHLEGHAASLFLEGKNQFKRNGIPLPMLLAVVSGGHTNLYLLKVPPEIWPSDFLKKALIGKSRDDAAGEAFDKTAKILGFPYPGGAWIDRTAKQGNKEAFAFPRPMAQDTSLDFSFSGLKTAVLLKVEELKKNARFEIALPDLCASIQEAIVDTLLSKISLAIARHHCRSLALVGGVSANTRLRDRLETGWKEMGLAIPPLFPVNEYCTDNGAMIAAAGAFRFAQGNFLRGEDILRLNAIANPEL